MDSEQHEPETHPQDPPSPAEPAMLFCPVCDSRLAQSRCKLVCERCGYFMSCADYY